MSQPEKHTHTLPRGIHWGDCVHLDQGRGGNVGCCADGCSEVVGKACATCGVVRRLRLKPGHDRGPAARAGPR